MDGEVHTQEIYRTLDDVAREGYPKSVFALMVTAHRKMEKITKGLYCNFMDVSGTVAAVVTG